MEAAMARITRDKRAVEADPKAAIQASLDASMAKFRRRVLWALLVVAALGVVAYLLGRG
jgi:hypothetical protein